MVFSFLKKSAALYSADRIAQAAISQQAFDGGAGTSFSVPEIIEVYYAKYGSTEKKFDFHKNPGFYIGYVRVPGHDEFLSVVMLQPKGSVAASFRPDIQHGEDLFGLMGKKAFADQVASSIINVSRGQR